MRKIYFIPNDNQAQIELIFLSKHGYRVKIEERGTAKHMNVRDAARFLAALYFKVDNDYQCDRPKIEKMLSIAQIIRMYKQKKLFKEDVCVKDCGLGVNEIMGTVFMKVHFGTTKNEPIEERIKEIENPDLYRLEDEIDIEDKLLLTNVFLNFGAYDQKQLGRYLDEFKGEISTDNILDENKIYFYFKENEGNDLPSNPIYKYICENINNNGE